MSTTKTISYAPVTTNKRVVVAITREIKSSPDKIFPLACPVEELRWIPDWDYNLVYSVSGVNETNCIFTEEKSGPLFFEKPLATTWVTAEHDPDKHRILFQIFLAKKAIIRFEFTFRTVGKELSSCTWHLTFTAIDEETNQKSEDEIQSKLELMANFLADALKHYCETGEILK